MALLARPCRCRRRDHKRAFSSAARQVSSAARVGLPVREYSKPLWSPSPCLRIGRGLVDRRHRRAGGGIGRLPGVDGARCELHA